MGGPARVTATFHPDRATFLPAGRRQSQAFSVVNLDSEFLTAEILRKRYQANSY